MSALPGSVCARVTVRAAGRLHLGFFDPDATLGRRFGSLGLMIDGFQTHLEIGTAAADDWRAGSAAAAAELDRAAQIIDRLRRQTGRSEPLALTLHQTLPAHTGFGSGTQLALALGRAFARWQGLDLPTATLAAWLARGQRSGIGIAGFDSGGLLVDGGPGAADRPGGGAGAPLLARLAWPAEWRVIVVQDPAARGLHGTAEREAMSRLEPMPRAQAADICHQVLMRVLPGAAGGDFAGFAAGLNAVQHLLGAHFAPAQQGRAWTSAAVGRVLHPMRAAGAAVGQSSWGPTGFAIVPSAREAERLVQDCAEPGLMLGSAEPGLVLGVVSGCNRGAWIEEHREDPR